MMSELRTNPATGETELLCDRCTQPLSEADAVWLDLNSRTNQYSRDGWPAEVSQGWFAFGAACARKALKEGAGRRIQAARSRYH